MSDGIKRRSRRKEKRENYKTKISNTVSVSSYTKTSVWSLPFTVTKRRRNKKWKQNHRHLHAHAHFTCVRLSATHHGHTVYWLPCERTCDMEACSDLHNRLSLTLNENKEKAKRRRVQEVKILRLWRVSLRTVCVCPRWDLSNPCFIIRACFWTSSDLGSRFVPNLDRHISFPSY